MNLARTQFRILPRIFSCLRKCRMLPLQMEISWEQPAFVQNVLKTLLVNIWTNMWYRIITFNFCFPVHIKWCLILAEFFCLLKTSVVERIWSLGWMLKFYLDILITLRLPVSCSVSLQTLFLICILNANCWLNACTIKNFLLICYWLYFLFKDVFTSNYMLISSLPIYSLRNGVLWPLKLSQDISTLLYTFPTKTFEIWFLDIVILSIFILIFWL